MNNEDGENELKRMNEITHRERESEKQFIWECTKQENSKEHCEMNVLKVETQLAWAINWPSLWEDCYMRAISLNDFKIIIIFDTIIIYLHVLRSLFFMFYTMCSVFCSVRLLWLTISPFDFYATSAFLLFLSDKISVHLNPLTRNHSLIVKLSVIFFFRILNGLFCLQLLLLRGFITAIVTVVLLPVQSQINSSKTDCVLHFSNFSWEQSE